MLINTLKCPAPSINADSAYPLLTPLNVLYKIMNEPPRHPASRRAKSGEFYAPIACANFNELAILPIMGRSITTRANT